MRTRPTGRPAALPIALAAVLVLAAVACWLTGRLAGIDSAVYRAGALAVAHGHPLYGDLSALLGGSTALPFLYPPAAAVLFLPLAGVPQQLVWGLVGAGSVVALWVTLRAFTGGPARRLLLSGCFVAALCLEPVWRSFGLGQINLVLMGLVVLDVLVLRGSRRCGVLLGLAAVIKLTPLLFIAHLFFTGRRADAVRALATFAVTIGAGGALLPRDSGHFWTATVFGDDRSEWTASVLNQSLLGFLQRVGDGAGWTTMAHLAGSVACVAVAAVLVRRLHRVGDALGALLVTAGCALVISPISWSNHWVWGAPLLAYLASRRRLRALVLAIAVFSGRLLAIPPDGGGREHQWDLPEALAGNAYLLATIAAGLLLWLRTAPGTRHFVVNGRRTIGRWGQPVSACSGQPARGSLSCPGDCRSAVATARACCEHSLTGHQGGWGHSDQQAGRGRRVAARRPREDTPARGPSAVPRVRAPYR